jgi:glyoxalase family protein
MNGTNGIHHITAISGDPQGHLDFYTEVLGLRMVKLTVNFDDPSVHHTYFADYTGTPGTVLTFFPFPGARRGRTGRHMVSASRFAAPPDSLEAWQERLAAAAVEFDSPVERFGERTVRLRDPEGLTLELVEADRPRPEVIPYAGDGLDPALALGGFEGVELAVGDAAPTADLLTGVLGYRELGREGRRTRLVAGEGAASQVVDLLEMPEGEAGRGGAGTVHHVAFRAASEEQQAELRAALLEAGVMATEVRDRQYFRSIYFREPNGVLFEIATDGPGFTIDEPTAELGSGLRLPPQYEPRRAAIEASLPELRLPALNAG